MTLLSAHTKEQRTGEGNELRYEHDKEQLPVEACSHNIAVIRTTILPNSVVEVGQQVYQTKFAEHRACDNDGEEE